MSPKEKLTNTELNAYLDGELSGDKLVSVETRLAGDPEAARKVAELERLDDAIRSRFAPVLDEPLPEAMQAVLAGSAGGSLPAPWMRMAASVLLLLAGGAAGYFLRGQLEPAPGIGMALVDNALSAHTVYVSEVRHPVEVGASEEQHLVKWLTKRLGAPVKAPALTGHGYHLLGGRLLANAGQPAAQFMYENAQGSRLTLYVRPAGSMENTAFRFAHDSNISAFYWIDSPLAYALVGDLSRPTLLAIARATYQQLN